jgi:hypothetical protein
MDQERRAEIEAISQRRRVVAGALLAGVSYSELSRQLGVSKTTIAEDVQVIRAEWKEEQTSTYDEHVTKECARLDRLTAACWDRALRGETDAINTALKITDRRARLLRLDQTQKHEVKLEDDGSLDEVRSRLEAIAAALTTPDEGQTAEANGEGETTDEH